MRYDGDKPLVRNNPFKNKIINSTLKREINEKIAEINKLTDIANERPLSPPEFKKLNELQKEKKILESNFQIRPSQVTGNEYYGQSFSQKEGAYDFYPMMKESTWTKLALKSLIQDARKNNIRYIAIGGADDYNFSQNFKKKIEQYYGLSGNKLKPSYQKTGDGTSKFDNKDGKGVGKYRNWETGKLQSKAVVPKAMEEIAKELGAKVVVKKVMKSDINKPFKIQDSDGKIVGAFSSKAERDIFLNIDKNNFYEGVDITDIDDPRNYNINVVIDLAGSNTGRMKAYKLGGLVEVKREYFAPLFG